jgi:hypothetical protein
MKAIVAIAIAAIAIAVTVSGGCVVNDVSSVEQELCTIGDQEAGTCTLRILTRDTARSQVPPGETIVAETYGVCVGNYCAVRIELPQVIITSVCIRDDDGTVVCESASCTRGETGCPG